MFTDIEKFIQENAGKLFLGVLFAICFTVFAYRNFNADKLDNNDYSLDKNIQDNFVLPPQTDDKYLHFKEENKLTVINYFSLDCPYCRKLFKNEELLVKEFGDKVNFAFRDKPLSSEPLSYEKALIKECIYLNNQNSDEKYFAFTKEVFTNYEAEQYLPENKRKNDWVAKRALKYVTQEQLNNCLSDQSLKQKILGFRLKADASQIVWTPTIVVFRDGIEVERVEKVWPEIYKKVLEKYTKN